VDDSVIGNKPAPDPPPTLTALADPSRLKVAPTISQDEARLRAEADERMRKMRTMLRNGGKWSR
jgi:hypothetical protein